MTAEALLLHWYNYSVWRRSQASPAEGPGTVAGTGEVMADQPRQIVVCSCEDTMPLDAEALRRGCRGAEVDSGRQLCRAELDRFRGLAAAGGDRSPSPARRKRRCSPRVADEAAAHSHASSTSAKLPAGRATPRRPGRRWPRCSRPPPSRCRTFPFVSLTSDGVILIYGRDEQAIEAAELLEGSSRRHRADHDSPRASRRGASPNFRW